MPTHSRSDPTPTTEAGRRFVAESAFICEFSTSDGIADLILAIETQARAEALREAAERVRALQTLSADARADVLAILTETER